MANTIKLRRSAVQGAVPTTSQILLGELGVNTYDGKLFLKKSTSGAETGAGTSIVEIGAGGGGDVTLAGSNAFTGANTFTNTSGQTFRQAATQDGIVLRGRAGGTGSHTVEIVPGTLTGSRTITCPDGDVTLRAGTVAVTDSFNTFAFNNTFQSNVTIDGRTYFGSAGYQGPAVFSNTDPRQALFRSASTQTTASANSTIAEYVQVSALRDTISASNTNITYTNATSFYYAGPPIASTNVTFTNAWTQYIAAGRCYFGGGINVGPEETTRYLENAANGSNYVAFKAPASIPSNVTWTLPSADATSSGQVLSSDAAGTLSWITPSGSGDVTLAGNNAFTGANTFAGNTTLLNQADLRFGEATANGSNYVGFQAPASITADVLWTLPATDGSNGQVLSTNGSGTLSWASGGGGSGQVFTFSATAPSSPAAGDEWFDSSTGILYTRINDGNTTQWVETGVPGVIGPTGATGSTGATGNRGGVPFTFSTTVTDADPGSGFIRYSSATIGSVTQIFIDNLDQLGNTQTGWFDTWDDSSTAAVKGQLYITSASPTGAKVNVFNVTGAVTATGGGTGYYKIPVAYVSGTLPANNEVVSIEFARTGNQGSVAPKAIAITNPTAAEKVVMFFTTESITLSQIRSAIIGGTSVDFRIVYGTDISGAGTNTTTNAIVCNSTTTGVSTTSFSSATVPANNFVWLTTSAVSGTVGQLHVSLIF